MRGKFSEPQFVALFFSNPGETVLKRDKTSWTQDLRVKLRSVLNIFCKKGDSFN